MSFRIGGVEVSVSFWFFASVLFFLMADRSAMALPVLGAIAIHECGHLAFLRLRRASVAAVDFSFSGMRLRLAPSSLLTSRESILLNLAGCTFNLGAAGVLAMGGGFWMLRFSAVNSAVALFNLLPLQGLDGGAALQEALIMAMGWERGQKAAHGVHKAFCVLSGAAAAAAVWADGVSPGACLLAILFLAGLFCSARQETG